MSTEHFCITLYLFNPEGSKVLLIKHKKLPWYLPVGGHIEENEDYLTALKRECNEEAGITNFILPKYLHPEKLNAIQPYSVQRNKIDIDHTHDDLIFAGIINENTKIKPFSNESQDFLWFEVEKIESVQTSLEVIEIVSEVSKTIQRENTKRKFDNDLYAYPRYGKEIIDSLSLFSEGSTFNDWNLGDLYTDVPMQYANKMGAKYGIFVNSGTSGLHASLIACGLLPCDEVIVPSMTFIRATTPLTHLQLQPVCVDVDQHTGNLDPDKIKDAITKKTKAIIVVHMWGVPADLDKIRTICDEYNLKLIEDFSHAHFSKYKNNFVGSYGDTAFASLQRKKTLSVGEGGIIVTSDIEIFNRLKDITSPGSFVDTSDYSKVDFSGFGLNMRMSPFSAVVAKELLKDSDKILSNRRENLKQVLEIITQNTDKISLPEIPNYTDFDGISWYSYKPILNNISLNELKAIKPWKFSDLGYTYISDSNYWIKDQKYFPFNFGIRPILQGDYEGTKKYLTNRISLGIPSIDKAYWSEVTLKIWIDSIKKI